MVANGRVHPALEPMMRIQEAAGEEKKRNSDCQHLGWQKRKGLCKMKHQRCIVGIPQRNAILPSCTPRTEHTNKLFHVKDFCLVVNASFCQKFLAITEETRVPLRSSEGKPTQSAITKRFQSAAILLSLFLSNSRSKKVSTSCPSASSLAQTLFCCPFSSGPFKLPSRLRSCCFFKRSTRTQSLSVFSRFCSSCAA